MSKENESSTVLLAHLSDQSHQMGALRQALDDCIKKREDKSYLNTLALRYGEAAWWKRLGLFLSYFALCGIGIYTSGLSFFWMLPCLGAYFASIFFISNHYRANQTLNTKTLEVLEGILSESIDAMDRLKSRFHALVDVCSQLNALQEDEQATMATQLQRMKAFNERYGLAVSLLEPLVQNIGSAEKTTQEKSQLLLNMFERTQAIMVEGRNALTQRISPKINDTITVLEGTQAQFIALKANFQKNLTGMNAFVEKLEQMLRQIENKPDIMAPKREAAAEKTKTLCHKTSSLVARAQKFLDETPQGSQSMVSNTKNKHQFFGTPSHVNVKKEQKGPIPFVKDPAFL